MRTLLLALALSFTVPAVAAPADPPLVLAAASLQESLTEAAAVWTKQGHKPPVISFAASSVLARQVAAGAPADLFFSADVEWMDYLTSRGLVVPGTRADVLGNRLVLVAPVSRAGMVAIRPRAALAATLTRGPVAIADPDSVPAGRYAKAALTRLGVWESAEPHMVRAENVRAALALVERGAAPLGIVYATDALASKLVRIVGSFPAASHPPIVYPVARLTASSSADAEGFRRFLVGGAGKAIFARYGFSPR